MNAKKCKELRRIARRATVGKPERQLVRFKQATTSVLDKDGKTVTPYAECAVNAPGTTRELYRFLKRKRMVDPKHIVMERATPEPTPKVIDPVASAARLVLNEKKPKPDVGLIARAAAAARTAYRRFAHR